MSETVMHETNETKDSTHNRYGIKSRTLAGYVTGFILSFLLTTIAFLIVGKRVLNPTGLYLAISVLALLQFMVQSIFFLRLNADPEGRWNLYPFIFAIFVVIVVIGGSLWIMYNLNIRMM